MADHRRALARAVKEYGAARDRRDAAIRAAHHDGLSYRAIGEVVGLSYSRVMQIVRASH